MWAGLAWRDGQHWRSGYYMSERARTESMVYLWAGKASRGRRRTDLVGIIVNGRCAED
jgi:hypothetical protein